jgi:hypothetical protein
MDVNSIYQILIHLNPTILIIVGIIVFIAGKFAKWIGIIAVILGVILLALPYLLKVIP